MGRPRPVPFTDMLDVIKDTGFDGFRFVGWPEALEKYDLSLTFLDRELSKRGLRLATLSFHGEASRPRQAGGHRQIGSWRLRVPEAFRRD